MPETISVVQFENAAKQFNHNPAKDVIVITGPTASGKSAAAVELCKKINGEIISADSMQIYRGMDIGTAKPSHDEQEGIPHHMIDLIDPTMRFSVAEYKKEATGIIYDILHRGKIPVLCGGTGLYLSAMIEGTEYTPVKTDVMLREELENELEEKGVDSLWDELSRIDPEAIQILHRNDTKRILRAIEVYRLTGKTKTELNKISKEKGPEFTYHSFCINHDRDILYQRINMRVDQMLDKGLLQEIDNLLKTYPGLSNTAYQAIGYKEFMPYLRGEITLREAVDAVKQATRNYAKRQLTWFRKMDSLIWIQNQTTEEIVNTILQNLNYTR